MPTSCSTAAARQIALDESLVELRASDSTALSSRRSLPRSCSSRHCSAASRAASSSPRPRTQHGVAPIVTHALEGPIGLAACRELARAIGADVPVGLGPHVAE